MPITLILTLCLLTTSARASVDFSYAPLFMSVGEQRTLTVEGLDKYSVSGSSLRATRVPERNKKRSAQTRLLLKGLAPGRGEVWILRQDGETENRTVVIQEPSVIKLPEALLRGLSELERFEVLIGEQGVLVRGEPSTEPEVRRLGQLKKMFPQWIQWDLSPKSELLSVARDRLQRRIDEFTHQAEPSALNLRVEWLARDMWIHGWISDSTLMHAAESELRVIYPLLRWNVSQLPDSNPTAFFRIFLVEIKKHDLETLGLRPVSGIPTNRVQLHGLFSMPSLLDLTQLEASLEALSSQGEAKILSKPELVVRIPGKAELFAGGELPIKSEGKFFSETRWKPFGLELKLNATHDGGDRVRMEISTQWSQLGEVASGEKLPRIQSNRLQTQVDAIFGRPLMLCGLIEESLKKKSLGIPGLKEIPIFGRLFGSEEFINETSELIAIILPHRSPPSPASVHADAVELLGEFEDLPRGPLPPPRDDGIRIPLSQLRKDPRFPWIVFDMQRAAP